MTVISGNSYTTQTGDVSGTMGTTSSGTTKIEKTSKTSMSPITDFMESLENTASTMTGVYVQDSNAPKIPQPNSEMQDGIIDDAKEQQFKSPYGKYERTIILQDYGQALENGLKEYVKSQNLSPEDSKALLSKLSQAYIDMSSGKTPVLPQEQMDALKEIEKSATNAIQKQYALPSTGNTSWKPTSTDDASWTPVLGVETKGVDPLRLERQVIKDGATSFVNTLEQMADITKNILDKLPANSPDRVAFTDFLKEILQTIQKYKEFIFYLQQADAERAKSASTAKTDVMTKQSEVRGAQSINMQEAQAKQKAMGAMGIAMKVLGPIISAGLVIVGAATSWLLGAGLILIAIGVVVGTIATAYTIIDSATDLTSKIFTLVDMVIEKALRAMGVQSKDIWTKYLIEAALVFVLMAPLVLFVLCAPASLISAGSAVGTQTTAQIVKTAIQVIMSALMELIKQISIQVITTVVVPSISKVLMPMLKESGLIRKMAEAMKCDEQVLAGVIEGLITAIVMIGVMGLAIKAGIDTGKLGKSLKATADSARSAGAGASKLNSLLALLGDSEKENVKSVGNIAGILTEGVTMGQTGFKVSTSIASAVMHFQMAQILKQKGDLASAEQAYKGMLDILNKLMKSIQEGMIGEGEFAVALTHLQNKMRNTASQTITNLFSQAG